MYVSRCARARESSSSRDLQFTRYINGFVAKGERHLYSRKRVLDSLFNSIYISLLFDAWIPFIVVLNQISHLIAYRISYAKYLSSVSTLINIFALDFLYFWLLLCVSAPTFSTEINRYILSF